LSRVRPRRLPAAVVAAVALVATAAPSSAGVTRVAVVLDGPSPENALVPLVESELQRRLKHRRAELSVLPDAGWDPVRVRAALDEALSDRSVDLVLVTGILGTLEAARPERSLSKPVVSVFAQRTDLLGLPRAADGASLSPSLAFTVVPHRVEHDVEAFRELVGFERLHVLVGEEARALPGLDAELAALSARTGVRLERVSVGGDLARALEELADAEAVYVLRLPALSLERRAALYELLTAARLPSFSLVGHRDVELGALAAQSADARLQLARRAALSLARLAGGGSVADLPIALSVERRMLINGRTATAIGWAPRREHLMFAHFLHEDALEPTGAPMLSLDEACRRAAERNLRLSIADSVVDGVRADENRARSALMPQLQAGLSWLDKDDSLLSPIGDDATLGTVSLRQLVFDDAALTNLDVSRRLTEAEQSARAAERLDVMAEAGARFLAYGQAEALYRVELSNLRLTQDFLELARLRRDVGYSGRGEVLRWEASLAEQRTSLFRAAQGVETRRIALNQSLNERQDQRWLLDVGQVDEEVFPALGGRLDDVFLESRALERFRSLAVEVAFENAPELAELDFAIESQELRLAQLRRRYWAPTIFAQASYSTRLTGPSDDLPSLDDDWWTVELGLSYPLFEGGLRRADIVKARAGLETLKRRRALAAELIEQRTRTAIQAAESSFPRVRFSRQAREAAVENLGIVRDQYAEGVVNVTDLLSAQAQAFAAEQQVVIAVHELLADLVQLQRSLALFEHEMPPEETERFVGRVRAETTSEAGEP
jgi:outer membrane protein